MFRLILVAVLVMAGGAARIKSHNAKDKGMDEGVNSEQEAPTTDDELLETLEIDPDQHEQAYAAVYGNSSVTCSKDAAKACPQCKLKRVTQKCAVYDTKDEKVDMDFPIRIGLPEHNLPEELQGVFWLTAQGSSSALVSFGQSDDGGGLSIFDEKATGRVRVGGDRVWSFSDLGGNFAAAEKLDLVYDFKFDSVTKPRTCSIYPGGRNYGIKLNKYTKWLLNFQMDLAQCPTLAEDAPKDTCGRDSVPEFPGSFVWQRTSFVLTRHVKKMDYKAVQVIKADGTKLPAFKAWLEFCADEGEDKVTGNTPGEFHYHVVDNTKTCDKKQSWLCRRAGKMFC